MNEQTPLPKFDSQNYARPNQAWICGHSAAGEPCPLGPDRRGRCQASAECVPSLDLLPGETKGRWRCNRPGEKCERGPLPDGSCCRPIRKCDPVPTLRTVRGRVNRLVIALTCAALLILLGMPGARQRFINPGPLSSAHSFGDFVRPHGATNEQSCGACHKAGNAGPNGILTAALQSQPRLWQVKELVTMRMGAVTQMDEACQNCHRGHSFHQPNTAREVGCAFCHKEHQGTGRIAVVTDRHCAMCHAQPAVMAAAAAKGATLAATIFAKDRPAGGFTKVIHSFATDHPDFRAVISNLRDQDTLKFNHQLHLTGTTIPALANGQKLDCAFCHQPDSAATLMRPISFEKHCRVCHSLQFDPQTPELKLPHGDAGYVTAFLHSLPQQYLELARRLGITEMEARKKFAENKLAGLKSQLQPGEDFERRVFLSNAVIGPVARSGLVEGGTRAVYPGCAYCHQVSVTATGAPDITKPKIVERWFNHSQFEHGKHSSISCTQCHAARQSKETADILLPSKKNCIGCHSPRGGVTDACVTCHTYHKPATVTGSSFVAKTSH